MSTRTVAPATQRELSRLLIVLDHPHLVARACGHVVNRDYFGTCPRTFPKTVLKAFANRYWRLLVRALDALVASSRYLALPDYKRARAIREEQTSVARAVERTLSPAFVASGLLLPGDTGRYPQRWGL